MIYDLRIVMDFAFEAHKGQVRKYTGEPYITHPLAVYGIVREFGCDNITQAAALLHDTVEDCEDITIPMIATQFDTKLAHIVDEVTDPIYKGNRRERFEQLLEKWDGDITDEAQSVRLADILHNIQSIALFDTDFARIYLGEKYEILPKLQNGNQELYANVAQRVMSLLIKSSQYELID